MTTAAQIRDALLHPNVQAFLRIIRAGESNQSDSAYKILYGGDYFSAPPWKHPFDGITTTAAGRPTAAGAYQFLGTTFAELAALYPEDLADFSPQAQDFAAVADIDRRHTLQNVIDGDLRRALEKLKTEWVSLPGLGYANAASIFQAFGGTLLGEQPAAPIEEQSIPAPSAPPVSQPLAEASPMGAFILPLIQTLIGAFAPAATQQLSGILNKAGGDGNASSAIVSNILALVAQATGTKVETLAASPQEATKAVAAVMSDADKLKQVQDASIAHLNAIAPMVDKLAAIDKATWDAEEASRTAAATRNQQMGVEGVWLNPAFIIAAWVLTIVGFVVASVLWKDAIMFAFGAKEGMGFSTDMQAFVIGAIVGGALTAIIGYFFGSSKQSAAKDVTINELAKVK